MLPRALAQPEIIFWSHNAYEMKPMDLGECNGMLSSFIGALHEELKQGKNLLCLFIAFFQNTLVEETKFRTHGAN